MSGTKPNSARKRRRGPAEQPRRRESLPDKQRRCILSRREHSTANLIRFVAGPDNRIVPDLAERLPGRGLWLSANRAALDEARTNGSFAKAARTAVTLDAEVAAQVGDQLAARALDYLGLILRASAIAIGHDQVRADLTAGRADTVHAALRPSRLSDMFLRECGRLAGFRAIGESRLPASGQQNELLDRVGSE